VISTLEGKLKAGLFVPALGRARNAGALWKGVSVFVRTLVSGGAKGDNP